MGDVKDLFSDLVRMAEEIFRLVWMEGDPRPGRVYGGIDGDIGHMHAFRSQVAGQRLGKDALRRLGRCEHRGIGDAPMRGGIPVTTMVPWPVSIMAGARARAR